MGLPRNLFLIRHGESVGNVAMAAAKKKDYSFFTEEYKSRPGRSWELSETGVKQAQAMGVWLRENVAMADTTRLRNYVSPLVRTKRTAAHLNLVQGGEEATWWYNRSIRERDWGEIELMPTYEYREAFEINAIKEKLDPLYWRPPGGESIADLACGRVREFFDTLHRECDGWDVFAVSHGEYMRALLLAITRSDDETYAEWEHDDNMKIKNCETFHFTREDPFTGAYTGRVVAYRRIRPELQEDGTWQARVVQDWTPIEYRHPKTSDLLKD